MLHKNEVGNFDDTGAWMPSDLISAVKNGDLDNVKKLLRDEPSCIHDLNEFSQNALQAAILTFHDEISNYLLDKTDVSVCHRDVQGRDALDLALFGSSEELCQRINDRWYNESQEDFSPDLPAPGNH